MTETEISLGLSSSDVDYLNKNANLIESVLETTHADDCLEEDVQACGNVTSPQDIVSESNTGHLLESVPGGQFVQVSNPLPILNIAELDNPTTILNTTNSLAQMQIIGNEDGTAFVELLPGYEFLTQSVSNVPVNLVTNNNNNNSDNTYVIVGVDDGPIKVVNTEDSKTEEKIADNNEEVRKTLGEPQRSSTPNLNGMEHLNDTVIAGHFEGNSKLLVQDSSTIHLSDGSSSRPTAHETITNSEDTLQRSVVKETIPPSVEPVKKPVVKETLPPVEPLNKPAVKENVHPYAEAAKKPAVKERITGSEARQLILDDNPEEKEPHVPALQDKTHNKTFCKKWVESMSPPVNDPVYPPNESACTLMSETAQIDSSLFDVTSVSRNVHKYVAQKKNIGIVKNTQALHNSLTIQKETTMSTQTSM